MRIKKTPSENIFSFDYFSFEPCWLQRKIYAKFFWQNSPLVFAFVGPVAKLCAPFRLQFLF